MHLDPLILSRLQWAWVIGWHILLPSFTVGLGSYIAVLEGLYVFSRDDIWLRLSRFWTRIFSVAFVDIWMSKMTGGFDWTSVRNAGTRYCVSTGKYTRPANEARAAAGIGESAEDLNAASFSARNDWIWDS